MGHTEATGLWGSKLNVTLLGGEAVPAKGPQTCCFYSASLITPWHLFWLRGSCFLIPALLHTLKAVIVPSSIQQRALHTSVYAYIHNYIYIHPATTGPELILDSGAAHWVKGSCCFFHGHRDLSQTISSQAGRPSADVNAKAWGRSLDLIISERHYPTQCYW